MKKLLLSLLGSFSFLFSYAIPSVEIHNNNVDSDVAETIKDELTKELSYLSNHQISIELTQIGDVLTINFLITPENKKGQEVCNDVWRDLDQSILKLVSSIRKETANVSNTSNVELPPNNTSINSKTTIEYTEVISQQPNTAQPVMPAQSSVTPTYTIPTYNIEDAWAGRAPIGGLIIFPDGSRGVIFYLDNHGHGLAVSLDGTKAKWEDVNNKSNCHDNPFLPNEDGVKLLTYKQGINNTSVIIQSLGIEQAPAAAWCVQKGDGWYLPSAGELWYLFSVENALKSANNSQESSEKKGFFKKIADTIGDAFIAGPISQALMLNGGQMLKNDWYWSSTENDKDEAINVSSSGRMSSEDKIEILSVRAIRAF